MRHVYSDIERWGTVCVVDLCWSDLNGYVIQDVSVNKKFQGQGVARDLMRLVLEQADAENVPLYLAIVPSPPATYDQLEAWYRRLGFVPYEDDQDNLFWRPRVRPIPDDRSLATRASRRRAARLSRDGQSPDAVAVRPG